MSQSNASRHVIVTGGCGFIGSHLVDRLISEQVHVTVIDNLITGKRENLNPDARFIHSHVEDQEFPEADMIVHLAALARIQPSFRDPLRTFRANDEATFWALEQARRQNIPLVFAGSSSCYDDIYANPYTYTKWVGEQHCLLYRKVFGVQTAVARFFNVYGPRQIEDGPYATVVGIFERQRRAGEPLTVTGTGEQRRDFTHVLDIVDGLRLIMDSDFSEDTPYQLGSGENFSINEVADCFGGERVYLPKRPGEAWVTLAEVEETKKRLGFVPSRRLPEYVRSVVSQ